MDWESLYINIPQTHMFIYALQHSGIFYHLLWLWTLPIIDYVMQWPTFSIQFNSIQFFNSIYSSILHIVIYIQLHLWCYISNNGWVSTGTLLLLFRFRNQCLPHFLAPFTHLSRVHPTDYITYKSDIQLHQRPSDVITYMSFVCVYVCVCECESPQLENSSLTRYLASQV